MKNSNGSQSNLMFAIVFAAIIIGGSLVYLGSQMSGSDLSDKDLNAILDEVKKDNGAGATVKAGNTVSAPYEKLVDDDAFIGDKNAPITLIEFSDYECPFCGRHFRQTLPSIIKDYVDTGKVKLVFRDFPLGFHVSAIPAAMAAECVRDQKGDEAYFEMHDMIFEGQANLGTNTVELLAGYASDVGVNASTYKACVDSEKFKAEIQADMAAGSSFGVNGTPGFVLTDGETSTLISGAQAFSTFKAKIDALLEK